MGWLLPCNTSSLRKHKPFVPYPVSLSNNDVIAKAFSRNITGSSNLAYSKKVNPQVPVWLSFQELTLFLGKKSQQNAPTLQEDTLFYSFSLIFCDSEFNYITTAY